VLGTASITLGAGLFSWTVVKSQDITVSSGVGWFWYAVVFVVLVWASYKTCDAMSEPLR
jgi:hypothetical protein